MSPRATWDFQKAVTWTADTFGPAQARTYRIQLRRLITTLAAGPLIPGSIARDDLVPGVRTLHMARIGARGRHLVAYRVHGERIIEVARILHDAMDLERHIAAEG